MPFWRAFYHIVWATKNREPLITPDIEPKLYTVIVRKAEELGVFVYEINGSTDHVHIVAAIPPHVSVSDLVKNAKGASSYALNQQSHNAHFGWQRGYGVLTLGQRQRPDAEAYVRSQKDHHRTGTAVAWLERCSEINEAPDDLPSLAVDQPVPALREPSATYEIIDEPAF